MSKVIAWLKGKKSYLVALAVVVWGLYLHFFNGHLGWDETISWILGGTGLATVRAAIAKVGIEAK